MDPAENDTSEPVGYVVSNGWLFDFLHRLSIPVLAWPGQSLFRVVLHGHGFVLPVQGLPPRIGFFTTYFVAARNVRNAEARAKQRLTDRWATFYPDAEGELQLEIEDLERLHERFRKRSHHGFAFYSTDD